MVVLLFVLCAVFSLIENLARRKIDDAACDYRRRWTRYKLPAPLHTVVQVRGMSRAEGHSVTVSEGGVCLFAAAELPVGGVVDILLKHPYDTAPIRVRGSIRNRSIYLYGIEFLEESALAPMEVARLCEGSSTSGLIPPTGTRDTPQMA